MKKIAIVLHGASVGGIETALTNMLRTIDCKKYNITLFTNFTGNPCVEKLPPNVSAVDLDDFKFKSLIKKNIKSAKIAKAFKMLFAYFKSAFEKNDAKKNEIIFRSFSVTDERFDCAISYKQDYFSICTALFQIKSDKKVMWLHGPIWKESNPDIYYVKWLEAFGKIYGVSSDVIDRFNAVCPQFSKKSEVFLNIMDAGEIKYKSEHFTEDVHKIMESGKALKLLSVGRFCEAKNFDNVPFICKNIIDLGVNVKWFLIGYGEDEQLIKNKISENGMENHVIILGKKDNPFPYIAGCDVYVQPSRIEGRSISVVEAQILAKPVIITEYPTSHAQLKHGYDGMIVPMDNVECAKGIAEIIKDGALLKSLSENAGKSDYCNKKEVNKLYSFLEEGKTYVE